MLIGPHFSWTEELTGARCERADEKTSDALPNAGLAGTGAGRVPELLAGTLLHLREPHPCESAALPAELELVVARLVGASTHPQDHLLIAFESALSRLLTNLICGHFRHSTTPPNVCALTHHNARRHGRHWH